LLAGEFPGACIHPFEPNETLCAQLQHRFASNQRVDVWNVALHERAGSVDLQSTPIPEPRPCCRGPRRPAPIVYAEFFLAS
jgi:hypothetical protein